MQISEEEAKILMAFYERRIKEIKAEFGKEEHYCEVRINVPAPEAVREHLQRLNVGKRNGERWELEDLVKLEELCQKGEPIEEIAVKLGRTFHAIRNKIHDQKFKTFGLTRRNSRWAESDDEDLKKLLHQGKTHAEIAKVLGRTPGAVQIRVSSRRSAKNADIQK